MKTGFALLLALAVTTRRRPLALVAARAHRARVTYTECVSGDTKTNCRSSRNGSSTYTSCR